MLNRRPYRVEGEIRPGSAVVQGSGDNQVKAPDAKGGGDFIGLYSFEANETKKEGDSAGIVLHGVAKALAGGTVAAGKKAVLKEDASGALVTLPEKSGRYEIVGVFLQSGSSGDYVDVLVERGGITIKEA